MSQTEKQLIFEPPESMCEQIVAAGRAMKTGD